MKVTAKKFGEDKSFPVMVYILVDFKVWRRWQQKAEAACSGEMRLRPVVCWVNSSDQLGRLCGSADSTTAAVRQAARPSAAVLVLEH